MKNINIISWNVNGLKSIDKKKAMSWLHEMNIDFLFLQETKLSEQNYNFQDLFQKKFDFYTSNISKYSKGFSGTMSCSKYNPETKSFCFNIDKNQDGRIIEYRFKKLILLNVYFPNGKLNKHKLVEKLNFYKDLLHYCIELRNQNFSIVISGDFNTAYLDLDLKQGKIYSTSGFSNIEREHFKIFFDNGFTDSYRHIHGTKEKAYTLFPYRSKAREKNEGWRVDYILISNDLKDHLKDAYILENVLGSDHCPIGVEIDLSKFN